MKLKDIGTPVSTIAGVGASLEKTLAKVGIFTVANLLSYWPKTWEDRTRKIPLSAWHSTSKVHTIAQVLRHDWFGFGRMRTLKIIIDDGIRCSTTHGHRITNQSHHRSFNLKPVNIEVGDF